MCYFLYSANPNLVLLLFFFSHMVFLSHLRGEHVCNAVHRSLQQQTLYQETEKYHIGEEGAEVHHLREK